VSYVSRNSEGFVEQFEPVADLAVLAAVKGMHRLEASGVFNLRLYQAAV